ncbi:MAG: type I secretion system permease/ATPase [Pseudomonadota bacterium]
MAHKTVHRAAHKEASGGVLKRLFRSDHWLFGPVGDNGKIYGQTVLAAAVVNFLGLFSSFFIMTVYDRVLPNNAMESLIVLTIGVVIAHIFDFCLKSLRGYFVDVAGQRLDAVVGARVFDSLMAMRLDARKGGVGATASLVKDFDTLKDFFSSATLVALVDLPFIFVFVSVIALIGGPIAFIPLIAVFSALLAGLVLQPIIMRHTKASMGEGGSKHGVLIETLAGLETVKSAAAGDMMRRRWREGVVNQAKTSTVSRFLNQFAVNFAAFCQQITQVGVVVAGVLLVSGGGLSMGGLIACVILTGRAMAPLGQVAGLLGRVSGAMSSYKALNGLMGARSEVDPNRDYLRRSAFVGRLAFKDVSFSYPGQSARALDDVSFTIEPGERVAILGRNGSGKSTIVRLALGVYEPSDGQVFIDDTDIRQIRPSDLRANMGAVLQDVCLFSGTVKENITLGLEGISDDAVLEAARAAGVHDFIGATDAGYDMMLAERGEGLSGGQRQAIALARALVSEPGVLLLDEPSSALDNQAEAALIARLKKAVDGRTLVVVTHRTSMLKLVERIIVIDGGRVVADGPQETILRDLAGGSRVADPNAVPARTVPRQEPRLLPSPAAAGISAARTSQERTTEAPSRAGQSLSDELLADRVNVRRLGRAVRPVQPTRRRRAG